MSILEAAQTIVEAPVTEAAVVPPYRRGDRITVTSPAGDSYLVRVEAVTPTATGDFTVLGAIVAPRKFRSHLLSTVVNADGVGPTISGR
jgi:hypothetical protein